MNQKFGHPPKVVNPKYIFDDIEFGLKFKKYIYLIYIIMIILIFKYGYSQNNISIYNLMYRFFILIWGSEAKDTPANFMANFYHPLLKTLRAVLNSIIIVFYPNMCWGSRGDNIYSRCKYTVKKMNEIHRYC